MNGMVINASLLVLYVIVSSLGLYNLKGANGTIGIGFFIGLAFYGLGFLIWYGFLARMPLSVAFPLAAGSLVIATQFVGAIFLGESLSLAHLGGVGLIVAGIAVAFAKA
jgi:multidrug transporter EmrE-like cation transporter